jgi:hypothetical protein
VLIDGANIHYVSFETTIKVLKKVRLGRITSFSMSYDVFIGVKNG